MIALARWGIKEADIYMDKLSGKDFNRPQYRKLLRRIKPGDLIVIKSIDRLGRNYQEIIDQWRVITKHKGADVLVLDMPLLDTRKGKDLMGTFIADMVLQLLSYVAQTERENIRQRQAEGIEAAKIRGVQFGRPCKDIPPEFHMIRSRWETGEISGREAARQLAVSHNTFFKWINSVQS